MIVVAGWSSNSPDGEALPPIGNEAITWNTHNMIRERFDYPIDNVFFGEWLEWFYGVLNQHQRRELRKVDLSTFDVTTVPAPPQPKLF